MGVHRLISPPGLLQNRYSAGRDLFDELELGARLAKTIYITRGRFREGKASY